RPVADAPLMGRFVSATGQFLTATYRHFSRPPTGSFSCPLTDIEDDRRLSRRGAAYDIGAVAAAVLAEFPDSIPPPNVADLM
ncbi:hypothetical protein, partial [Mycobacterium sp.]|uniref:hypothetical protein n=1 Tax=Mycobacterium sp. TaxID=1785 RepID=UPI0025FB256A